MSGHTPGPWTVTDAATNPDTNTPFYHYIAGPDGDVAKTWAGPHIANARLIAAAPEMYDVLCRIHSWLVCAPIASADDIAQSFEEFEQQASKAIAKAEGRS